MRPGLLGRPSITPGGWGVRWAQAPDAPVRLFCVPHAGGGAGVFRAWAEALAPHVDVVAVRLPGRESRWGETPVSGVSNVVPPMTADLRSLFDRRGVWFGHSVGGLLAYEAVRSCLSTQPGACERLVVAATRAPDTPPRRSAVHAASDDEFMGRLRELGGVPDLVLAEPSVMAVLMPALRADFATAETYRHVWTDAIALPITVFGGVDDGFATSEDLGGWRRHTTVGATVDLLPGGHFFPHEQPQLLERLRAVLA